MHKKETGIMNLEGYNIETNDIIMEDIKNKLLRNLEKDILFLSP